MEIESKIYDVKITDIVREQMIIHAQFLANVSVTAANKLVSDFLEVSDTLSQMPERCPWLIHDAVPFQKYRKVLLGKYHMALFEIRQLTVYITAVVDCRQEYSWLL